MFIAVDLILVCEIHLLITLFLIRTGCITAFFIERMSCTLPRTLNSYYMFFRYF